MIIVSGRKHICKPAELVVLADPHYVKLILDCESREGRMPRLRQEFLRLIERFDQKRLSAQCRNCSEQADLLAFYKGTLFHEAWCSGCAPYMRKGLEVRRDIFCDFMSAMEYVDDFCGGDIFFYRMIIRNIAKLKGLPEKFGAKEAVEFFRQDIREPQCIVKSGEKLFK